MDAGPEELGVQSDKSKRSYKDLRCITNYLTDQDVEYPIEFIATQSQTSQLLNLLQSSSFFSTIEILNTTTTPRTRQVLKPEFYSSHSEDRGNPIDCKIKMEYKVDNVYRMSIVIGSSEWLKVLADTLDQDVETGFRIKCFAITTSILGEILKDKVTFSNMFNITMDAAIPELFKNNSSFNTN